MPSNKNHDFESKAAEAVDEWEEFRDEDSEPIRIEHLVQLNLGEMPEDIRISVMDDYFPDTTVARRRIPHLRS